MVFLSLVIFAGMGRLWRLDSHVRATRLSTRSYSCASIRAGAQATMYCGPGKDETALRWPEDG